MKKIGLICLAVVVALGVIGIGFAHWSQTLFINGTVETGDIDAQMRLAVNADGANYCGYPTSPDPVWWPGANGCVDDGIWDSVGQYDLPRQTGGPICSPNPGQGTGCCGWEEDWAMMDKDVGNTRVYLDGTEIVNTATALSTFGKTMTVDIANAYPDYSTGFSFLILNQGSVPIDIMGFKVIGTIPPELNVVWLDIPPYGGNYTPCYIQWLSSNQVFEIPDALRQQLDPGESRLTGIAVHCKEQSQDGNEVAQNMTGGSAYTFSIEIWAEQWNASSSMP